MKSVILVRHAKSSWDFNLNDFDRPLNHRGENDAPKMAKRILKREIKIDTFLSSPAKRAITTATYFATAFDKKEKNIKQLQNLYEATVQDFFNAIEDLDDDSKTVALFSHNPGITAFANALTTTRIDDMPTCAVFAVKVDIKRWKDFNDAKKEFLFFDYPKSED